MAKMAIENVQLKLEDDGTRTVPEAEGMVIGKVTRDGEKWTAAVGAEDAEIGRQTTEHPTRQAAFAAIVEARGLVKPAPAA